MAVDIPTSISKNFAQPREKQASARAEQAPSAIGALLIAAPFAALFSIIVTQVLEISWFWAIPIYGVSGAALTGLFVAFACCTRCRR